VKKPSVGYQRHGALGVVAGSLIASVNIAVKPTVGTLSSITWLSRGTYASVRNTLETYKNEGRHISSKLFDTASLVKCSEQLEEDDDGEISLAAKTAATKSGFHPKVCQHILQEFEKIKKEREQKMVASIKKKKSISDFLSNGSETLQALLPNRRLPSHW
jgi:hypothetical protein